MRPPRWCHWAVVLVLGAVTLGCGHDASMSAAARQDLASVVARVRAAANRHDVTAANAELASLRTKVDTLRQRGALDNDAAQRILAAADAVRSRLSLLPTTTTSTTTTTTVVTDEDDDHHGRREKHGEHGD